MPPTHRIGEGFALFSAMLPTQMSHRQRFRAEVRSPSAGNGSRGNAVGEAPRSSERACSHSDFRALQCPLIKRDHDDVLATVAKYKGQNDLGRQLEVHQVLSSVVSNVAAEVTEGARALRHHSDIRRPGQIGPGRESRASAEGRFLRREHA